MRILLLLLTLTLGLAQTAPAGDSYEHRVDEAQNAMGPNRCMDSRDCDGKRTCSPWGWCQGTARPKATPVPTPIPTEAPTPAPTAVPADYRPKPGYHDLSGAWYGEYLYDDGRDRVSFRMDLRQDQGTVNGRSTEPNSYADEPVKDLFADINGRLDEAGTFSFRKRMDGTGGAKHHIDYRGQVTADGRRVQGTWSIPGRVPTTGTWWMERQKRPLHRLQRPRKGPRHSQVRPLAGDWTGEATLERNIGGRQRFKLKLVQDGPDFSGQGSEEIRDVRFGRKRYHAGIEAVQGLVDRQGRVRFVRRIQLGQHGLMEYSMEGLLSADGRTIRGTWSYPPDRRGNFTMKRSKGRLNIERPNLPAQPVATAVPTPLPTAVPTAVPTARPSHPGHPGHPERPEHPYRPERPERPEHPGRPERPTEDVQPTPQATVAPTPAPTVTAASRISGIWSGMQTPTGKGNPFKMELSLSQFGGGFSGHYLLATPDGKVIGERGVVIDGSVNADGELRFSTRRDGDEEEGGIQNRYEGRLVGDGKVINGSWDHPSGQKGHFNLHYQGGGK